MGRRKDISAAGDPIDRERSKQRRTTIVASVLLVAGITALRFSASDAEEPITVLYVIPVAILAAEFGIRVGVAAALLCFGLFELAVAVTDLTATFLDDVIRLAVLLSVGITVGLVGLRLRRAMDELEFSTTILRTVSDATPDVIYAKDREGRFTLMNAAGARFLAMEQDDVIGRTDHDLVGTAVADALVAQERQAVQEDRMVDVERRIRLQGEDRTFRGYIGPLRDVSGEALGVFGTTRDVTEQVRTTAIRQIYTATTRMLTEFPEPEELAARLAEAIVDGEVVVSAEVLQPGTAPAGTPGRPHIALAAGGHDFGTVELEMTAGLAESEATASLMAGIRGLADQYLERRVAEREAERVKNEFFGLISHELRTPLTSIVGYTELLAEIENERLSSQGKGFIEVIDRNARRQLRLVQDLLLLVRLEGGRFDLELGENDLRAIVAEGCDVVRPQAASKDIELALELEDVGRARCDAVRLGQTVDNLLTNAIKFTPPGGRVSVALSRRGEEATLVVTDSGIGVAPDEVEHLFDRLYRASSAVEHQIQGTGLGLTIVKAVAEAHGGSVVVESELGEGTRFTLRLPVLLGMDPPADPPRNQPEGQVHSR